MIPQHIHARTLINQLAFGLSNGKLQFDLLIVLRVMGKQTLAMCNVDVTAYKKKDVDFTSLNFGQNQASIWTV